MEAPISRKRRSARVQSLELEKRLKSEKFEEDRTSLSRMSNQMNTIPGNSSDDSNGGINLILNDGSDAHSNAYDEDSASDHDYLDKISFEPQFSNEYISDENSEPDYDRNFVQDQEIQIPMDTYKFISNWALQNDISYTALEQLLNWFSTSPDVSHLPKDPKTILRTPKRADIEQTRVYIIVEFSDEKSAEGIPLALISSDWMFKEEGNLYCYWPTYFKSTTQREKAVRQHQTLKYKKCDKRPITVKYSTDNYKNGRMKLRLLEDQQSDSEESLFQNDSIENGNREDDFINSYHIPDDDNVPSVPPKRKIYSIGNENREDDFINSYEIPDDDNVSSVPPKRKFYSIENENRENDYIDSYEIPDDDNVLSVPPERKLSSVHSPRQEIFSEPADLVEYAGPSNNENDDDAVIKKDNCVCDNSSTLLQDLVREVQNLKKNISPILRLHGVNMDKENDEVDAKPMKIDTYEKLKEFDEDLNDEEYFRKSLTKFGLVGGRDVAETTRKVLRLIMSNELACSVNWSGRNQKPGIEALGNIVSLIQGSVRRNPVASQSTNEGINNVIKTWLRNANDRAGGRSKRRWVKGTTL